MAEPRILIRHAALQPSNEDLDAAWREAVAAELPSPPDWDTDAWREAVRRIEAHVRECLPDGASIQRTGADGLRILLGNRPIETALSHQLDLDNWRKHADALLATVRRHHARRTT